MFKKINNRPAIPLISLMSQLYGSKYSVPIDQQPSQEFNIDVATGRPMSDITAVVRSQKLNDMQSIVQTLGTIESSYLPEGVSDEDAVKYAKPWLAQLPSELADYAEFIAESRAKDEQLRRDTEYLQQLELQYNDNNTGNVEDSSVVSSSE